MRVMDCRVAWKYAYTLTALLYYINQLKIDDLTPEIQATVEYHFQRLGEALRGGDHERSA